MRNNQRNLTSKQTEVLEFIRSYLEERGFPPTYAEIAQGLGFRSVNAAAQHVRLLAKKGRVHVERGVARGLRLLDPHSSKGPLKEPITEEPITEEPITEEPTEGLPLVGSVAAGQPILAAENLEDRIACDPALFHPPAHFLLRVRGTSMIDAGIFPGDLVAIHKTAVPAEGAIALVRLEDEVTIKRWRQRDGLIVLEPENPTMSPMSFDPSETSITCEGLVVGLIRSRVGEGGPST